jgi:hypothetical protein
MPGGTLEESTGGVIVTLHSAARPIRCSHPPGVGAKPAGPRLSVEARSAAPGTRAQAVPYSHRRAWGTAQETHVCAVTWHGLASATHNEARAGLTIRRTYALYRLSPHTGRSRAARPPGHQPERAHLSEPARDPRGDAATSEHPAQISTWRRRWLRVQLPAIVDHATTCVPGSAGTARTIAPGPAGPAGGSGTAGAAALCALSPERGPLVRAGSTSV